MARFAEAALMGLASGAQIGPQKSAGAAWGAGIGAGAKAEIGQAQQQDLMKKQQAQEDFDTQQKKIANRAIVAHNNASVYRDYMHSMSKQWDRDPEYANTQSIKESLDQYNDENSNNRHDCQILTPEPAQAMFAPGSVG